MIVTKEIETRSYLTKSKLPDSDYVINPYIGCPHGCKYCYASFMKRFTGHTEEWGSFVDIKRAKNAIDIEKLKVKKIFLSSVTDCYNKYEETYKSTRDVLKQLIGADCQINISTKSKLILRDLDILTKLKNVTVAISINTLSEKFKDDMDCASSIKERLDTLKQLHDNGIYTILFMSPIFPFITEWKEIIEKSKEYIDEYWFENLNLRGSYKKLILDYIKDNYQEYYSDYINVYEKKNKDYWKDLAIKIEDYCNKHDIKYINYFYHEEIVKK